MLRNIIVLLLLSLSLFSCQNEQTEKGKKTVSIENTNPNPFEAKLAKYAKVKLTTDEKLTHNEVLLIDKLKEVAKIMDNIFWKEAYGDKDALLQYIEDPMVKEFININYGPWDRLNGFEPFLKDVKAKPAGANFYPSNMTKEEFEGANLKDKESLYTIIGRDDKGALNATPYHKYFGKETEAAAKLIEEAATFADNAAFKNYLLLRAKALRTDEYRKSDLAWLDMKTNHIDVVVGPIETYEDQLFGYKASHSCYILVKDMVWSKKLEKYAKFLPELQKNLPVAAKYKTEVPGSDTELNAYDVIYYAGDCNAGSKTIAINLPNDEVVQLKKGTRRLQLKNAMKVKFDKILVPISLALIDDEQQPLINFDAFFANTMFHEVAHGLGIKNTINGKGSVRKALKEHASALEEGKADMLGLYMVRQLHKKGELTGDIKSYYTTFMASIFRSVRFGSSSAHGKANMIRFNYFKSMDAFAKNPKTGKYKIDFEKFEKAMDSLSEKILVLQGNGDYEAVASLVSKMGIIDADLQKDLDELSAKGIPVDVVFEQ